MYSDGDSADQKQPSASVRQDKSCCQIRSKLSGFGQVSYGKFSICQPLGGGGSRIGGARTGRSLLLCAIAVMMILV